MFSILSHQENENQNNSEVPCYPHQEVAHADQDIEQVGVSSFPVGVQTCTNTLEVNLAVPQKTWNNSTFRPRYTTPDPELPIPPGHPLSLLLPSLHLPLVTILFLFLSEIQAFSLGPSFFGSVE